jgi:hypothetical protein
VGQAIAPSFDIADPYQPENRASRGEKSFGVVNNVSNVAATSFGVNGFVNPINSGRISILKRVTWSLNLPTAANQPGNIWASITVPAVQASSPTIFGQPKDTRWSIQTGVQTGLASGILAGSTGIAGVVNGSLYAVQVFPGASTVPTIITADNLDIVVTPGWQVLVTFRGDTLPVATYTWTVLIEGFERTADPMEFVPPGS